MGFSCGWTSIPPSGEYSTYYVVLSRFAPNILSRPSLANLNLNLELRLGQLVEGKLAATGQDRRSAWFQTG